MRLDKQIDTIMLAFSFVGPEMLVVLVVVLVLFGGKKIPELMKGFGKGIKEFKDATKEDAKIEEK